MAFITVADDVLVDARDFIVTAGDAPVRRGRRDAAGEDGAERDALRQALREADFAIVGEITVEPPDATRRGADAASPAIAVAVGPDEDAVLLIETADGMLAWQTGGVRADSGGAQRRSGESARGDLVTFRLGEDTGIAAAAPGGRRSVAGWLAGQLIEPVRTYVLRFLVQRTIAAITAHIEGDMPTGPVHITGRDPALWTPAPLDHVLDPAQPARILLMIHGTFSSTAGSFGALAAHKAGQALLDHALDYDMVLGFDHRTLADDPLTNAEAIMAKLVALRPPPDTVIDAIGFSRGGLILRLLAERLVPRSGLDLVVDKALFVGCTNSGTLLARPENWKDLVDFYTNIVVIGARLAGLAGGFAVSPLVTGTVRTLGRFVQMLSQVAISERFLPGLAAMEPGGAVVTELGAATAPIASPPRYHVIAADFEPRGDLPPGFPGRLAAALADRVTDRLFKASNDLVVHTRSMASFGSRQPLLADGCTLDLPSKSQVFHTSYFANERVAAQLLEWLREAEIEEDLHVGKNDRRSDAEPDAIGPVTRGLSFDAAEFAMPAGATRGVGLDEAALGWDWVEEARESAPAPAAPPPAQPVERHLAAEMMPFPALGRDVQIYVTVSADAIAVSGGASSATTEHALPLDAARPLTIIAIPRSNCVVAGDPVRELRITDPGLQLVSIAVRGVAAGAADILLVARQGAAEIASFHLQPVFVDPDRRSAVQTQPLRESTGTAGYTVLRIYETYTANGALCLRFDISSDDPAFALLEEVTLRPSFSVDAYVATVLAEIENAWNLTGGVYDKFLARFTDAAIIRTNVLMPEKIRKILWEHRAAFTAVQVISEEPLIPWELMYISDSKRPAERHGFLSEWGLIRWLHGARPPGRRLGLDGARSRYVIPTYLDARKALKGAAEERRMLEERLVGITPIEADSLSVSEFLRSGASECDVLHFACHGEAEQKATLNADLLMTGIAVPGKPVAPDSLAADQVKSNAVFSAGQSRSLVFVNACRTGREGRGIAGVAGFADSFLRPESGQGAAAFIGALWSIDDTIAKTFAETLYTRLEAGDVLVKAVKQAREACKASRSDFTWLAYSVFGNPLAKAVPSG